MPSMIGKGVPRVDAVAKVTGTAQYVYDMQFPGMLWARVLRSTIAFGEIVSIDASEALAMPGVRAFLTGKEIGDDLHGTSLCDEPILARDIVRFYGEGIGVIAADTEEIANEALKKVKVVYREMKPVFDVEEAFSENPPAILHPDLRTYKTSRPPKFIENRPNVYHSHRIQSGDLEQGYTDSDVIVEHEWRTAKIQHVQMEPHCAIAEVEANGDVTVHASINTLYACKNIFCRAFNLPKSKVRVRTYAVGGGFGGKQNITTMGVTYALAKATGRPVKYNLTREEVFIGACTRHPTVIRVKDGVKKNGTLMARDIEVLLDGGGYSEFGFLVVMNCCYAAIGTYKIPNFRIRSYGIYTNAPICGAYRGFGNVQVQWATECQNDLCAEAIHMDPMEFRLKNVLIDGDRNPGREIVFNNEAKQCMEWVEKGMETLKEKLERKPLPPNKVRGYGVSGGNKYSMAPTSSMAYVKMYEDGVVEGRIGGDEPGQGLFTVCAQMLAEIFELPMSEVRIIGGDTQICPYDEGSISSRATYNNGNAIRLAAEDCIRQIREKAAIKMNVPAEKLKVANKRVYNTDNVLESIDVRDLYDLNIMATGLYVKEGGEFCGKATWFQGTCKPNENYNSDRLCSFYTQGAQGIAVLIDKETGKVDIEGIVSSYDTGNPINPPLVEVQIEGGAMMAIGSALMEAMIMDEKGQTINANLTNYIIPTFKDMPLESHHMTNIAKSYHPNGPFGAKGLGEGTMSCTAPAIANAIYDAIGVRFYDLPITAEQIMAELNKKAAEGDPAKAKETVEVREPATIGV